MSSGATQAACGKATAVQQRFKYGQGEGKAAREQPSKPRQAGQQRNASILLQGIAAALRLSQRRKQGCTRAVKHAMRGSEAALQARTEAKARLDVNSQAILYEPSSYATEADAARQRNSAASIEE